MAKHLYVVSDDPKNRNGTVPIRGLAEARRFAYKVVTESRPRNGIVYVFLHPGNEVVGEVVKTKSMVEGEVLDVVSYSFHSLGGIDFIFEYVLNEDGTLGKLIGKYRS